MNIHYTIFWREDSKRWISRITLPPDPFTGEVKDKYITCSIPGRKGEQKIKRDVNNIVEKLENGDFSDIYKVTLKAWLEKYLKVYCLCPPLQETTVEGYARYINNHIIPHFKDMKLNDIKPSHIQNFYNEERRKGFKEKTILQEHRILSRTFEKAIADGLLCINPCKRTDAPSPEDYEPTIYTEEQFIELLDKLEGHRMEAIILIAGMCGLRRGELLGLTWEDIDLDNGILSVRKNIVPTSNGNVVKDPKTKKSTRDISISSVIIPILKRIRGIGKLYPKINGEDYNPGSVSREFKQFLEDNGLKHIRLHDLRHFNCTMMLKHGVSEREAMARSGHSNGNMIKKYQHILKEMDKKSAEKLNKVLYKSKKKGVKKGVRA